MDGRSLGLLDLPSEIISNEVSQWLTLESLLNFRQVNAQCNTLADTFIQKGLPQTPLLRIFNNEHNHYLYLCSVFQKNPAALTRLTNPETLLDLCEHLTPAGMLRLSIIFSIFEAHTYTPLAEIANSNTATWFIAFICCALLTPNIRVLNTRILAHAIQWLKEPENIERYVSIYTCLLTIHSLLDANRNIRNISLPRPPCYLNLQGANMASIPLEHANLAFANLQGADAQGTEFLFTQLFGSYLKNTRLRDGLFLNTVFFNLSDRNVSLTQQLSMLDHQLIASDYSARLDETVTTDMLNQIAHNGTANEQLQRIQLAEKHPFFAKRRLNNYDVRIAMIKAADKTKKPPHSPFFTPPPLNSAFHSSGPVNSITKRNIHQ